MTGYGSWHAKDLPFAALYTPCPRLRTGRVRGKALYFDAGLGCRADGFRTHRLLRAAPRLGRLVDRYGQRRTLLVSLAVHSAGTLALVISTQLSAPNWILLATAALSGAAALQVGSLVRARWSALVGGSPALEAAFALESTLDELIFVLGPALVTGLALGVAPGAGLLGALVLEVG
jgi:nitrate/nitrite transporter NarK